MQKKVRQSHIDNFKFNTFIESHFGKNLLDKLLMLSDTEVTVAECIRDLGTFKGASKINYTNAV